MERGTSTAFVPVYAPSARQYLHYDCVHYPNHLTVHLFDNDAHTAHSNDDDDYDDFVMRIIGHVCANRVRLRGVINNCWKRLIGSFRERLILFSRHIV